MTTNFFKTSPSGVTALLMTVLLTACGGKSDPVPKPPPPTVTVARPLVKQVTDWDEYTGRLAAVDSVNVRARVSGYLKSMHFKDGAFVSKGDLLFVIDPRPYQAALDRAKARADQAKAQLELARDERARAERLFESNAVSQQEFQARVQAEREAVARLEAAQAAVQSARLNLGFTHVRAPISGRISREFVTNGNLISGGTANSTLLTTIVSLDPIYVYFTADERSVLRYMRLARRGIRPSSRDFRNPVRLQLADEKGFPHKGYMDFVDNQIDEATGTMMGRAVIPNPNYLLVPGLFARVKLRGEGPYKALLVPDAAIGTDQVQKFVYVLGRNNIIARRQVQLGEVIGGLRVIRAGLSADDEVVIKGFQRVHAGSPAAPERASLGAPNQSNIATRAPN
ncbi:MAG TPA: efflux RND transporter periplasmic adaptor subunit [Gammaproteobacteria bacterium]|nr:efflux RND transporter periplasmic adaptor subunit [Gammaproteobacteria bacterium]